jgi:hypothetical protein
MATTIKLKNSVTTTNTPSSLAQGEVAINITDKKVWVGNAATTPVQLLGDGGSATFSSITVTGVSTFSAGTVSAPSITTSGDTNTGIYFPAADTIAFTEGGVEAMRITSAGNLCVGSADAGNAGAINVSVGLAGTTVGGLQLWSTTNSTHYVNFGDGTSGTDTYRGYVGYAHGSDSLLFGTSTSERMRIDSSGRVLIGTTSTYDFNGQANLVVTGTSNLSTITIASTSSGYLAFADGTSGNDRLAGIIEYNHSSDFMGFRTVATERMRIDSSGNVGIGTSSPVTKLELAGTTSSTALKVTVTTATTYSQYTNNGGDFYVGRERSDGGGFGAPAYSSVLYSTGAYPMSFWTNATERMRITSGGYLKASNTGSYVSAGGAYHEFSTDNAGNETLVIRNSNTSLTTGGIFYIDANRNTTNNTFYAITYYNLASATYKFRVADSGNVTNTNGSYGTISDIKNKENIVDATPKLDKVNQLKVRNFNFKGDELKQIGFVAQEFEQVFPSMVEEHSDKDADGNDLGTITKSIKTSVLVPILVKAIQEQQQIINDLKTRIETLESK